MIPLLWFALAVVASLLIGFLIGRFVIFTPSRFGPDCDPYCDCDYTETCNRCCPDLPDDDAALGRLLADLGFEEATLTRPTPPVTDFKIVGDPVTFSPSPRIRVTLVPETPHAP